MTATNDVLADRTAPRRLPRVLTPIAAGAGAFGLCCGLPWLASLGAAGVIGGLGVGSWVAVAVASVIVAIGVLRWRRRGRCAVTVGTTDRVGSFPVAEVEPVPTRGVRR